MQLQLTRKRAPPDCLLCTQNKTAEMSGNKESGSDNRNVFYLKNNFWIKRFFHIYHSYSQDTQVTWNLVSHACPLLIPNLTCLVAWSSWLTSMHFVYLVLICKCVTGERTSVTWHENLKLRHVVSGGSLQALEAQEGFPVWCGPTFTRFPYRFSFVSKKHACPAAIFKKYENIPQQVPLDIQK